MLRIPPAPLWWFCSLMGSWVGWVQNELAEISVCSVTKRGALGKSCRFSGQEKKSRKSHDQLFMKSYMICLSVAQSNYANIVSNCEVLRDLGERDSLKFWKFFFFFSPPLRQILFKTFHHPNLSSAQAFGRWMETCPRWRKLSGGRDLQKIKCCSFRFLPPWGWGLGVGGVGKAVLFATWPSENSIILWRSGNMLSKRDPSENLPVKHKSIPSCVSDALGGFSFND